MASFTERYHELTKYNPNTIDKMRSDAWTHQPPPFKENRSNRKIELRPSLPQSIPEDGLDPDSASRPSDPENLARLLFFTMGITAKINHEGGEDFYLRAAPSAGGLYPTEMYVAIRRPPSPDFPAGIYHYHSLESALIPVWEGDFWADFGHYFLGHPSVDESEVLILFTGIYARGAWRYKERAYRRILLDTGHALGNFMEVCETLGFATKLLGGFLDDGLEDLLFLDRKEEFPLLGVAVGKGECFTVRGLGQRPGAPPHEAVKGVVSTDPMQVQQNTCERIKPGDPLRPEIPSPTPFFPFSSQPADILKIILQRRSCRQFSGEAVGLESLRQILGFAFRPLEQGDWRLAPAFLNFHVIALNVDGLAPGIYGYDPVSAELKLQRSGDFRSECLYICLNQELSSECAFLVVYTADLPGLVDVCGDRGYRYICLDAGQIGERINLRAVHLGLGSSGIGGYYDDLANEILELPLSHGVVYLTVVGVPA